MNRFAWILLSFVPAAMPAQHLTIDDLLAVGGARDGGAGLLSPDGTTFAGVQQGQVVLRLVAGGDAKISSHS